MICEGCGACVTTVTLTDDGQAPRWVCLPCRAATTTTTTYRAVLDVADVEDWEAYCNDDDDPRIVGRGVNCDGGSADRTGAVGGARFVR